MKSIVIDLIEKDVPVTNSLANSIKDTFNNTIFVDFELDTSNISNELLDKCAGHILEELILMKLRDATSEEVTTHIKFNDNRWYDFKYDNQQMKILVFKEDDQYSITKLSNSQYSHKKDMTYLSVVYTISEGIITISDIYVTDGENVKFYNDQIDFDSILQRAEAQEQESEEDPELTALRMIYTSNLMGDVQILNL